MKKKFCREENFEEKKILSGAKFWRKILSVGKKLAKISCREENFFKNPLKFWHCIRKKNFFQVGAPKARRIFF